MSPRILSPDSPQQGDEDHDVPHLRGEDLQIGRVRAGEVACRGHSRLDQCNEGVPCNTRHRDLKGNVKQT